jgi:hypothetical protein
MQTSKFSVLPHISIILKCYLNQDMTKVANLLRDNKLYKVLLFKLKLTVYFKLITDIN